MRVICEKYSSEINKKINSLSFLYEGNQLNLDLSLMKQANSTDINKHEMKILVRRKENDAISYNNKKLIDNIKSLFFMRILFSYMDEKVKLKVIKYNKNLQNIAEIKLINYKLQSGRYILYESKRKGKEYDSFSDTLIFEGEYLNGERNGRGKEYKNGQLIFEGDFLNGKRLKGEIYDENGNLILV